MKNKHLTWLYQELPKLVQKSVISLEDAERIKKYYGEAEKKEFSTILLTVFGVTGAVLIGLGIILLLAFNWEELTRPIRVIISILPLLITQVLGIYTLWKKKNNSVWKETIATFNMASIGIAISLISQTYHIEGDLAGFLFIWMLLSFPLMYIFDAHFIAFMYLIGITTWAGAVQAEGRHAAFFWLLAIIFIPKLLISYKKNRYSNISTYLNWIFILCFTTAIGIVLEKVLPGLWIIIYACFFTTLYLIGFLWFSEGTTVIKRPFQTIGSLGIVILACIFTYTWPWREIGWHNIRNESRYFHSVAMIDYALTIILIGVSIGLLFWMIKKGFYQKIMISMLPLITIAVYLLISQYFDQYWAITKQENMILLGIHILYNLYLLILAIIGIINGSKNRDITLVNANAFIIALVISMRFIFVENFFENLLVRGLIFIFLGCCFFVMNFVFSRYFKKGGVKHES
ncbi:MAG: DUF2157 domain-containing protein [Spirochaetes bacterium]|nr:DUF2157 domain-containing protein [Spirochaetota bacterium]